MPAPAPLPFRLESFPPPAADLPDAAIPLHAVSAADPAVLVDILRPEIGLSIWLRDPDPDWEGDAAALGPVPLSVRGDPRDLADTLSGRARSRFPSWLKRDLCWLAGLLSVLTESSDLSVSFGPPPPFDPPPGLRLLCRYGGAPLCWSHPGPDDTLLPGGVIAPFAVALCKGACRPALRRRAIRLAPLSPPAAAAPCSVPRSAPILSIQSAAAA